MMGKHLAKYAAAILLLLPTLVCDKATAQAPASAQSVNPASASRLAVSTRS